MQAADQTGDFPAPLHGVRVLDLSRVLAGPFCTIQLADLGADVIKVEHPRGGDDTRAWAPPSAGGESYYFVALNRNKRSVAVDLQTPEGRDVVLALAAKCDVLVENFRGGVMTRLGLDYASLRTSCPSLIYCSISGYGQTGPLAGRGVLDPVLQAESGMMAMTGMPDGDPLRHPLPMIDTFASLYASNAILAALMARGRTGRGQHLDIAMLDVSIAVLASAAQLYLMSGQNPPRTGNAHPRAVPMGLFHTRTGPIYMSLSNDTLFRKFCAAVARPELAENPEFATNAARVRNQSEVYAMVQTIFANEVRDDLLERLTAAGIPAGAVRTVGEALDSPEVAGRGMVAEVPHPTAGTLRVIASPYKMSGASVPVPAAPPLLGQHTDEVLREVLGMHEGKLSELREHRVIA